MIASKVIKTSTADRFDGDAGKDESGNFHTFGLTWPVSNVTIKAGGFPCRRGVNSTSQRQAVTGPRVSFTFVIP